MAVDLAKAEARLDRLKGVVSLDDKDGDICWMYDEEVGIEAKVHRTLRDNVLFWQESGASQFALSIIEIGYIPKLSEDIDFTRRKTTNLTTNIEAGRMSRCRSCCPPRSLRRWRGRS